MPRLRTRKYESADAETTNVSVQIGEIGRRLSESFGRLLEGAESSPSRPKEVEKTFGMNAVFSQRLAAALKRSDPYAVVQQIPGPEPLRRLLDAARKRGLPAKLIEDADAATNAFENLIRRVAGDRSGLDAIIGAWLPETRTRVENEAKQCAYRGMRQLKGVAADTSFFTCLIHPGESEERFDEVILRGHFGLRCVRPGAPMSVAVRTGVSRPTVARSLDGVPIQDDPYGMLVKPFCAPPPNDLVCHKIGEAIVLAVNWGDAVGIPSARNLVMAETWRPFFRKHRSADDPRKRSGVTHGISVPTRTYFFDLLLHQDVYPDCVPTMNILELGESGSADPNDPSREFDILDVGEKLDTLGIGFQRFRTADLPDYIELLSYACDKMGWRQQEMRAYRARIEYPIFGAQVRASFEVPVKQTS